MTGAQLKRHREEAGLSQAGLAAYLDVHRQTVSQWERGVKVIPVAIALAVEHLGCRLSAIEPRCGLCGGFSWSRLHEQSCVPPEGDQGAPGV